MSDQSEQNSSQTQEQTEEQTSEQTNEQTSEQQTEVKTLTDKPAETQAEFVPLTAEDIKLPEGDNFVVDEELRDEFLGVVNNQELSPKDRAQGLLDLYTKAATKASETASNEWNELQTKWQGEVKADAEIGGAKLPETLGRIGQLIDQYGDAETRTAFDLTGAGNNPAVIKFLNKVAAKLVEGGPVSGQPAAVESSTAAKLFPTMKG